MKQETQDKIAPFAVELFAPLGNLFNLLSGTRNFPIIHQIITLLSTVPLEQALWYLKRLQAFNQGKINHDVAAHNTPLEFDDYVSGFSKGKNGFYEKLPGRRIEIVIGTIKELFGPDISFTNPVKLLDPDFLATQGLELCRVNDAHLMPIQSLYQHLIQSDLGQVVLGTRPIEGLRYYDGSGECEAHALLVWKMRTQERPRRQSETYIRLESCRFNLYMDTDYTKWVFVKSRSRLVI